jgi:hypothetical protein
MFKNKYKVLKQKTFLRKAGMSWSQTYLDALRFFRALKISESEKKLKIKKSEETELGERTLLKD